MIDIGATTFRLADASQTDAMLTEASQNVDGGTVDLVQATRDRIPTIFAHFINTFIQTNAPRDFFSWMRHFFMQIRHKHIEHISIVFD